MGFSCVGHAQQEIQFTQYMFNRLAVNPGYAGSSGSMCGSLMYRGQWLGLRLDAPTPGAEAGSLPTNYLFSFDSPVKILHGGLGLTLFADKIGYNSTVSGSVDYAFRIYWGPGNLSAGIEGNFYSISRAGGLLGPDDLPGDPTQIPGSSTDPSINNEEKSDFLIDASLGVYYQVPGSYYLGIALKNFLGAHSDELNFSTSRILNLLGGYEFVIPSNPSFRLKPSMLIRTADFSIFQIDASCLLEYQNLFWGGVSYRFQDAVSLLAGLNYNKMKIGIAYDLTTSKLGVFKSGFSFGSLEAYLRYCFRIVIPPKLPSSYQNTRYLL
ncbi:MAG: type IX secretion system membrane protein PorP/SprF [Bacteroidales bacterium]|nr:type IX secretion system membrane protein PorP/SprF [Bacteroidales bacterium]